MKLKSEICDDKALSRAIARIAHEICERNEELENIVFLGVKTRGVPFAHRLSDYIYSKIDSSKKIPVKTLDTTLYRDDLEKESKADIPFSEDNVNASIDGKIVILTDDVIFTGRTARAAMEAIFSLGRPSKIQLAVMVDRGHRELPIRPDFVGKNLPTAKNEFVHVGFTEIDKNDCIEIYEKE